MREFHGKIRVSLLVLAALGSVSVGITVSAPSGSGQAPGGTTASVEMTDGRRVTGQLVGDAQKGFRFAPDGGGKDLALETVGRVTFEGPGPSSASGAPPFHVLVGFGGRISGRLGQLTEGELRLEEGPSGKPLTIARAGIREVDQRPGETLVLLEGFEALDESRWTQVGQPEIVGEPRTTGSHSLRLAAGGSALTQRLAEPLGSGRLEIAFHDTGAKVAGQRWFVGLTFRGPAGPEPVQAILGWEDETLAVLSRGGPALAVQRLARKPAWHRLIVRFGPDRTDLLVDGDELAHGDGPGGPLVEIRLATETVGAATPPAGLAVHFDDLRLARFAEPVGRMEVDPSQDEARLTTGDQIFGRILTADAERILFDVAGKTAPLAWVDVAGLRFHRQSAQAAAIAGLWIDLTWRSAAGHDPRDLDHLEGVLTAVSERALNLESPYLGVVAVPLDRLVALSVLGRARRILLDANPHHLGNHRDDNLDPPQPEGASLEIPFELDSVPAGSAAVALDVVQVIGESGNRQYSERVKKGEMRTRALLNGRPFDDINRHILTRNETPERIRLPVPAGVLRAGRNVLRLEQSATKEDPAMLDNLGVLGVALEFIPKSP